MWQPFFSCSLILPTFNTFFGVRFTKREPCWTCKSRLSSPWNPFCFRICLACSIHSKSVTWSDCQGFSSEGVCAHCLHNLHLALVFNMLTRKLVQFFSSPVFFFFALTLLNCALNKTRQKKKKQQRHDYSINQSSFFPTRVHQSIFILHWIKTKLFNLFDSYGALLVWWWIQ